MTIYGQLSGKTQKEQSQLQTTVSSEVVIKDTFWEALLILNAANRTYISCAHGKKRILFTQSAEQFKELSSLETFVSFNLIETSNKMPRDFLRTFAHLKNSGHYILVQFDFEQISSGISGFGSQLLEISCRKNFTKTSSVEFL